MSKDDFFTGPEQNRSRKGTRRGRSWKEIKRERALRDFFGPKATLEMEVHQRPHTEKSSLLACPSEGPLNSGSLLLL